MITYASTRSVILIGATAHVLDVEADAVPGPAELHLIGLPELSVWPARARVRAAILNSGITWPEVRATVSVCPAVPPPSAVATDLAVAVAALAVAGVVAPEQIAGRLFLGELALDGGICPVRGVLPAVAVAVRAGITTVVVPAACAPEAAQVPGAEVIPVGRLADLVAWLREGTLDGHQYRPFGPVVTRPPAGDLADVPGNRAGRRALEVCAAGGHHLFLAGEGPAVMLAERLPGILPPLDAEAVQEVAEIHSLAGRLDGTLLLVPPLSAPHHTSTPAAIFGSATANRPGAVSLAHHGVLHLNDAPEFPRPVLDGLSQPMKSGEVRLSGLGRTVRFPARFTLVLDACRCPCSGRQACQCTPWVRRRYLDRLALLLPQVAVRARVEQTNRTKASESTAAVAARVCAARERAAARLGGTPWRTNAEVPPLELRIHFPVDPEAAELLRSAANAGQVPTESVSQVLRVAWTLADLRGVDRPGTDDAAGALELWTGANGDEDQ